MTDRTIAAARSGIVRPFPGDVYIKRKGNKVLKCARIEIFDKTQDHAG